MDRCIGHVQSGWIVNIRFLCVVVAAMGLTTATAQTNPTGCLDAATVDYNMDYFPIKVEPTLSTQWSITYNNTFKVLTNENTKLSYFLNQCGADIPSTVDVSEYDGVYEIPVTAGFAVTQTSSIAFLNDLGLIPDGLVAYGNDPLYISNGCVLQSIESNQTMVVSDDANSDNSTTLIFGFPFDERSPFPESSVVEISEFSEFTNGATYEWVKFYSAFFNLEGLANELFDAAQHKYGCTLQEASTASSTRTQVLWAYYSTNCEGWDVSEPCNNEEYQYPCQFATDCGVELIGATNGSVTTCEGKALLTTDEFVALAQDAAIWIYPSPDWTAIYSQFQQQLDTMSSVQSKNVFDTQKRGDNDWFEERYVKYYDVLEDFCSTIGTITKQNNDDGWFRNVFTESVVVSTECTASTLLPYNYQCYLSSDIPSDATLSTGAPSTPGRDVTLGSDAPTPSVSDLSSDFQSVAPTRFGSGFMDPTIDTKAPSITIAPSISVQPTEETVFGNKTSDRNIGSPDSDIAGIASSGSDNHYPTCLGLLGFMFISWLTQ